MEPQIRRMLNHQIKIGAIKDGDEGYLKLASDGTNITKRETATVTTLTFANSVKALQLATVAIVLAPESYQVNIFFVGVYDIFIYVLIIFVCMQLLSI